MGLCQGNEELFAWIEAQQKNTSPCTAWFACVDAPLICFNATGSRQLDRLTHQLFGKQHAGCYPANTRLTPRPPALGHLMLRKGWHHGAEQPRPGLRQCCEVYPHAALVRWHRLDKIVRYKKGSLTERGVEFARLQELVKRLGAALLPGFKVHQELGELLQAPWSKKVEDQTDALLCAMIGLHHWRWRGDRSEVIGDWRSGAMLVPTGPPPRMRSDKKC